ncbi:Wzz/FepE/Etk N-terminal domain-containing protein [Bradyrhizobium sp.]|uniref:Wzz/FepE/Etk N-terminal domain-containing protein n=1 Tax=Bradyrhizobium sp. TaxID=376 RepID=UPI002DDD2F87|nr:Wzz/FepE/Etk N-terminal domain-containing protein [Bradyrhizobium sp.]HEV2154873.1 Wzz/FepE/Etk N-terminal domain-containing protein [Bradyrhizobium sp.]
MTAEALDTDNARTGAARPTCAPSNGVPSLRDFVEIVWRNLKLLLIAPALAGLAAFVVTSVTPKWYTSVAYLTLDEPGARSADVIMRSSPVLDAVSRAVGDSEQASDALRDALDRNRRIVVAPGNVEGAAKLFRLEYSDRDPRRAQKINDAFISAWIDAEKPPSDAPSKVNADIGRIQLRLHSVSEVLDDLLNRVQAAVDANQKNQNQQNQNEVAVKVRDLILANHLDFADVVAVLRKMRGVSRAVVFSEPSLPQEPSWPKRAIVSILAAFAAGLIAVIFVLLRASRRIATTA